MIQLEMNMMGRKSTINPTLLYDDHNAILVDVGMPGQVDAIKMLWKKQAFRLTGSMR